MCFKLLGALALCSRFQVVFHKCHLISSTFTTTQWLKTEHATPVKVEREDDCLVARRVEDRVRVSVKPNSIASSLVFIHNGIVGQIEIAVQCEAPCKCVVHQSRHCIQRWD